MMETLSALMEKMGKWIQEIITMIAHLLDFAENIDNNYAGPTPDPKVETE